MARAYTEEGIKITCDICGKAVEVTQPKGSHGTGEWISSLLDQDWTVVMTSPVPFSGYDLCDECTAKKLDPAFHAPIKEFYHLIKDKNTTGAPSILQDLLTQIASKYIAQEEEATTDDVG